jgi:hypothetical protein
MNIVNIYEFEVVNVGLFITKVINEKMGFKKKSCQGYENQIFDSMKRIWNINTFIIQFFSS